MRQTEYVILGLLSESPMSGYQIKKLVDIRFKFFWSESFGQIFPALKSLSANGLVEAVEPAERDESQKRSPKKTYRLTEAGIKALRDWLKLPVERESYRLEILLKLYFANFAEPQVMIEHVEKFQKAHEQELQILEMFQHELEGIIDQDENHPQILRVIDFGQKANRAYLDWSRETLDFFERRLEK